ncbi:MAG: hypothetical protein ABW318_12740 [Vicinamibacterales bacterium]|jgi:uncharacterized protein (DUF58 family)
MSSPDEIPKLGASRRHYQVQVEGWPATLLGIVVGAVALVLAVMFSLVLLPALLGAGMVGGGYLWWRTRKLRKVLREEQVRRRATGEREVEGERLHVDELGPPHA